MKKTLYGKFPQQSDPHSTSRLTKGLNSVPDGNIPSSDNQGNYETPQFGTKSLINQSLIEDRTSQSDQNEEISKLFPAQMFRSFRAKERPTMIINDTDRSLKGSDQASLIGKRKTRGYQNFQQKSMQAERMNVKRSKIEKGRSPKNLTTHFQIKLKSKKEDGWIQDLIVNNDLVVHSDDEGNDDEDPLSKKKDKKLVFLSRSVLQKIIEKPMTTGTQIANEILELYREFCKKVDFKNVQRRVYDALNVLHAMNIIRKDKSYILYNPQNGLIHEQDYKDYSVTYPDDTAIAQQTIEQQKQQIEEMEERIRCKQELFLESIKQQVAIKKLLKRNFDQTMKSQQALKQGTQSYQQTPKSEVTIAGSDDQSLSSTQQSTIEKISLPCLFVKVKENSNLEVQQDQIGQNLCIHSSKKLQTLNENHLFEAMGLTQINESEIAEQFGEELNYFMKTDIFINNKNNLVTPAKAPKVKKEPSSSSRSFSPKILSKKESNPIQSNSQDNQSQINIYPLMRKSQSIKSQDLNNAILSNRQQQQQHRNEINPKIAQQQQLHISASFPELSSLNNNLQLNNHSHPFGGSCSDILSLDTHNNHNQHHPTQNQLQQKMAMEVYDPGFQPSQISITSSYDSKNMMNKIFEKEGKQPVQQSSQSPAQKHHLQICNLTSPYREEFLNSLPFVEADFFGHSPQMFDISPPQYVTQDKHGNVDSSICYLNSQEISFLPDDNVSNYLHRYDKKSESQYERFYR